MNCTSGGLCFGLLLQVLDQAQQDRVAELIAEEASSSPDRPATPSKNQVRQPTPLLCQSSTTAFTTCKKAVVND